MYRLGFNPTSGPVVIDAEGRTLGGGEWGPVDSTSDAVRAAVDAGALMLQEAPAEDAGAAPSARRAADAVTEVEGRRSRLGELDRELLTELARNNGVIGGEATPTKAELVTMLAPRTTVALPEPPAPARGRRASQEG